MQIDDSGITIYDWRTRKPLTVDRDECVEKIQEAIDITVALDLRVGALLRRHDSNKEWHRMLAEVFRTVEDQNREPE